MCRWRNANRFPLLVPGAVSLSFTMYGSIEPLVESQKSFLLKRDERDDHKITDGGLNHGSSRALNSTNRADDLTGTRTVRATGVLAAIMEKARHDTSTRTGTNITFGRDRKSIVSEQQATKSFVYTMLNPRSNSWEAVSFKWFITLVIIAVSWLLQGLF